MHGLQLALPVQLTQPCRLATFVAGRNEPVVAHLSGGQPAYLYGAAGVGKTHLLLAACDAHQGRYLPLGGLDTGQADILEGLALNQPLALDECDLMPLSADFWMRLLRLLDQRQQQGAITWAAGRAAPEGLQIPRDLQTRLMRLPRFAVTPLDEAAQARLLTASAEQRGLRLPDEVVRWWLRHLPRDAASLLAGLERIDRAALQARRRLTLPFVQAVLETPTYGEGGAPEASAPH